MRLTIGPKTIVIFIFVALFAVILIQNTQVVTMRIFFWKIAVSEVILVPSLLLLGFVVGFLMAKWKRYP